MNFDKADDQVAFGFQGQDTSGCSWLVERPARWDIWDIFSPALESTMQGTMPMGLMLGVSEYQGLDQQ